MVRLSYVMAAEELGLKENELRDIVTDYNANLEVNGTLTKETKMSLNKLYTTLMGDTQFLKDKELYEKSDTQRIEDPATNAAIDKIFGPNTPMGNILEPKAYTPREIEYAHPESLTADEKTESDKIRNSQISDAKSAIEEIDNYHGTGIVSAKLHSLGADMTLSAPIKEVVPLDIIYGFMDKVDNLSDRDEIVATVKKFTEANIKHNQIVPETYQHKIDILFGSFQEK
ncbi:MAG: hypothetical protein KAI18_01555 [Candidatus Aenigmarchaeota archaeon]|nr:hypothetical protein [Candidatus Aenigmarchaeota archaeon]